MNDSSTRCCDYNAKVRRKYAEQTYVLVLLHTDDVQQYLVATRPSDPVEVTRTGQWLKICVSQRLSICKSKTSTPRNCLRSLYTDCVMHSRPCFYCRTGHYNYLLYCIVWYCIVFTALHCIVFCCILFYSFVFCCKTKDMASDLKDSKSAEHPPNFHVVSS